MEEQPLARKAELAELLLDAARKLGETLEPERVYARFHELLGAVVPHDGIVVSSYSEEDDLIRCEYAWTENAVLDPSTLPPLPLDREGGGMQSRVILSGEPLLFNDVTERVEQRQGVFYNVDREGRVEKIPEGGESGTTAAMMVPVKLEGRVVGVVQVMSDRGAYTVAQLEVVEGLVGQMAAAVRNARLQKERQRLAAAEAAARAAAAEREQAARVLEGVGEGIFLLGKDGVVGLWNRAAERITGIAAADARRRPLAEVVPSWKDVANRIPVAEPGDVPRSVTLPLELGGRDLWLSFVAVRAADGIVHAFRDVTAERRLEAEKSDFVATVSHELRTPLAAVYGAAETLLRRDIDPSGPSGRELLEMIRTQTARLSQIVDEVLLTNTLDRGELVVERQAVDVAALIRATVDAMRPSLPPVVVEEGGAAGVASGDPDRIQQVLANLLDNAAKYGGGGPVHVRLTSRNGSVFVSVADSGPGIAPGEEQRIFEKFYRGDPQLTSTPGGTGLGLYISRELAHRMGGRLSVQSRPGEGATFVLELPQG
jgi:signal transduction histidine kinase